MLINKNTKIGHLLKHHKGALEAITSLSPKFEKLRNPFLRKLMAGRTSIGMAAKIAGCREDDFFAALRPLGFETEVAAEAEGTRSKPVPSSLQKVKPEKLIWFDVRPLLDGGNDPLKQILAKLKALLPGEVLKIINTFEPTPLIEMLEKKGYSSWTDTVSPQLTETWFYREEEEEASAARAKNSTEETTEVKDTTPQTEVPEAPHGDWDYLMQRFDGKFEKTDVRGLKMPHPMILILEALDKLPQENALYVVHKRVPIFLIPELADNNFSYRSRHLSENEVHLIIFRNENER